ncbi:MULTISPECIES: hypothetical protein [Streptomyces]|uniref:Integral membrane protein n=1 Tax=Streptomyces edwardsiae TaxID=3075527 RepID=A0ABU2QJ73_9ACTN|nr:MULTISPECIES: hypothetical protein [unclassified Streptomyces]MDT0404077.1 hypothetical protein [Streptomyces sp. DSM 41635]
MTPPLVHLALPLGERLAAYQPTADAGTILGVLAWCASAAGVAGLIIVGIQMSIQLRRGEPGEGGAFFRGFFYVTLGCLLATTAGPLVAFLGNLSLL